MGNPASPGLVTRSTFLNLVGSIIAKVLAVGNPASPGLISLLFLLWQYWLIAFLIKLDNMQFWLLGPAVAHGPRLIVEQRVERF